VSARIEAVRAALERLRHEETVESPESHSSVSSRSDTLRIGYFEEALGWRRLFHFKHVRRAELLAAESALEGLQDAEALAWRGRIRRLLGETREAKRLLERSLALAPGADAAAWLGEIAIYHEPRKAPALLERAVGLAPDRPLPRLWLGMALLKDGEPRKALAELDRALALGPGAESHVLRLCRCEASLALKDYPRAFEEAERAVRLDPDSPAGYHMAAKIKFAAGDMDAAAEWSNQARNRDINLEGPFFASLGVVSDWGDPEGYLKTLDRAIAKRPAMAALYAARAELKRDPKLCLYEEALADYEKAVALEPDCAWIVAVLARAQDYSAGGRAGLPSFDRAVSLCGTSGWIYAWRGAVRARLGEPEKALDDFARSLRHMPWYSFSYAWRGALYNRLGRFGEALADLDTAVGLDPEYLFSYNERFQAKRGLHDYAGAAADLNHAFARNPKFTWLGAGAAEADPKKRAELLAGFDAALKRAPREAWLHAWRGYSRLQWSLAREAIADLDRAAALGLKSAELEGWRGLAQLGSGRLVEAAASLRRSIRLNPKSWLAYKVLSDVRAAQGRPKEALAAIAKAARLAPTTVPVLVSQARLELQLGRSERALALLAKAGGLDRRYAEIHILTAEIRLGRDETALASSAVEKALALPQPGGRAHLIRGLVRQKLGDFKGQISDFAAALKIEPGLFQDKERRLIEDLVRRGGETESHAE
jgi:tetratricopeptide (TPR) repeat protein